MNIALPIVAGAISTAVFAISALPMLVKVARTRDMTSYSLSNIVLSNVGNVFHSIYVFNLPAGPVWVLHSFYLVSTGLMLVWYLRYARRAGPRPSSSGSAAAGATQNRFRSSGGRTWLIRSIHRGHPLPSNTRPTGQSCVRWQVGLPGRRTARSRGRGAAVR
jgi:uncharacterized protein with PQ loop repeat